MIYSTMNNKNTYEDPKTSTIFENLMLLPDNIVWKILYDATRSSKDGMPENIGYLYDYCFWPKWDPKDTENEKYVEPDVFFRFSKIDIIIESKYNDNSGQYFDEWQKEVRAYLNEYAADKKTVILLAVGGNKNNEEEVVRVGDVSCKIIKYDWRDILECVLEEEKKISGHVLNYNESSMRRIFQLIKDGFHIMGVSEYKKKTDLSVSEKIKALFEMFGLTCNDREIGNFSLKRYSEPSTKEHYIYRFCVTNINNPQEEFGLGLGLWYPNNYLSIEADPANGWSRPICEMIENKYHFSKYYLKEPYLSSGIYYFDSNEKFTEDFQEASSFDKQLEVMKKLVDELINDYLKFISDK